MKATSSLLIMLAALCIAAMTASPASAQDFTDPYATFWRGEPSVIAEWLDGLNWSAGIPGPETYTYINNGGTAAVGGDATHAIPALAGWLHLGGDIGGVVRQDGGWLTVTHDTWLGAIGWGMPLPELYPGPSGDQPGTYLLFDGVFSTSNLFIDSGRPDWLYGAPLVQTGSLFRQVGGRSMIGHALYVGRQPYPVLARDPATGQVDTASILGIPEPNYLYRPGAMYELSGGLLSAPQAYVGYGGKGRIDQQAGEAEIGALFVGGGQSYDYPLPMAAGAADAESLVIYPWYYDGGAYTLGGGDLTAGSVHVGQRGRGTFTQTGGTANIGRTLQVGGNWYWYPTLSDIAPATAADPDVAMTSAIMPEYYLPAHGTYSLIDGKLNTSNTEIGIGGVGRFVQSGGSHTVAGVVRVGGNPYWPIMDPLGAPTVDGADGALAEGCFAPIPYPGPASGSYTISDGSLTAGRIELGGGYGGWPIYWFDTTMAQSADMWAPIPWRPANFTQSGGEVAVDAEIRILGGNYHLAAGELTVGRVHLTDSNVYGVSAFTQAGGVARIHGELLLRAEMMITDAVDPATGTTIPYYWGSTLCTISGGDLTTGNIRLASPAAASFTQTGGHVTSYEGVHIIGDNAVVNLQGGSLTTGRLQVGRLVNTAYSVTPGNRLRIGEQAIVTVTDRLVFGADGQYGAEDGTVILMNGADLENYSMSSAALPGLGSTQLTFSIGPEDDLDWETFEVAGRDLGLTRQGFWDNFVLESLVLGGMDVAELQLIDLFDNQPDSEGTEALYVRELVIGPGSRLDLNGLNIYYLCSDIDPDAQVVGGVLDQIDVSDWAIPGDSDMDGDVDLDDFVCLKRNFGRSSRVHWGRGDYDSNGCVDLIDFITLKSRFSTGTAALPEPTTAAMLMLGAVLAARRRRR